MLQAKFSTIISILALVLVAGLYFMPGFGKANSRLAVDPPMPKTNPEEIANMLQRGMRINSDSNPDLPDADLYGAALVQIAMEHFVSTPEAAVRIRLIFASRIKEMPFMEQYEQ